MKNADWKGPDHRENQSRAGPAVESHNRLGDKIESRV